jgi:hypothetical protein
VGKPRPYGEYIAGMVPGRRPVKTKTNKNSFFSFSNHFFFKEIHEYSIGFHDKKFSIGKEIFTFFFI